MKNKYNSYIQIKGIQSDSPLGELALKTARRMDMECAYKLNPTEALRRVLYPTRWERFVGKVKQLFNSDEKS